MNDSSTPDRRDPDAGGTVTYTVYTDNIVHARVRASAGTKTVTNGVVPDSDALTFNTAGTFYWQAVYSGDDQQQRCDQHLHRRAARRRQDLARRSRRRSRTRRSRSAATAHDSSSLTGATATPAARSPTPSTPKSPAPRVRATPAPRPSPTASCPTPNALTFNTAGTFYWQAVYSGDANNNGATSTCTDEQLVVGKTSPDDRDDALGHADHGRRLGARLVHPVRGDRGRRRHGHLHRVHGQHLHRRTRATPARRPSPTASCPTRTRSRSTRPAASTGRPSTRATPTTTARPAPAPTSSWSSARPRRRSRRACPTRRSRSAARPTTRRPCPARPRRRRHGHLHRLHG